MPLAALLLGGCAGVDGGTASGTLVAGALLLVVLAAALGYLVATLRRAHGAHALQQRHLLHTQLSGEVFWAIDREQRWVHWRAPANQATEPVGPTLMDCFQAGPGTEVLRRALASAAPFGPLPVRAVADGSPWLLAAQPTTDLDGNPSGHVGVARPAPCGADAAALHALLELSGDTVLIVERRDEVWQVLDANGSGRRQLINDADSGATLPASLVAMLDAAPDSASEAEGWRIAPFREGQRRGFVLSRAADGADAGDTAAFSYTVSHDLRAPIRVVEGFTRIVKEDYGHALDRVGNDHLERVLGAAARMNQMIDAMLTLARLSSQPLARQPVNLTQLAGYVVDELRRAAPERAAEVEIEAGLSVTGDPTLLRLVLENLIGNAWKYSAKRGVARIVFTRETQDGRPVFIVRDNGAGFDMRSADRLFGLFQRLHSANDFPGTGVGLASVRRIVRRHGGEIWADAEPGKGAAFHFTLGA